MLTHHAYRVAALLAGAGLLSRLLFRWFETRWQILIFWALIAAYQFVLRPLTGRRLSMASFALDIVVVALAIVAMKVAIERRL